VSDPRSSAARSVRVTRGPESLLLLLLLVVLVAAPATAAASSVDGYDVAGIRGDRTVARFSYANDFFVGTDEYFTQGIGLIVFDPARGRGLVVRHDGFTPTSLRSDAPLVGDRPFSATLTAGGVGVWRRDAWTLTSELDAGVIGHAAFGDWMQTHIHRATGNHLPHGWSNQIANDAVLDASARLQFASVSGSHGDAGPYVDAALGTIYTNAAAGGIARLHAGPVSGELALEEKVVGYDATMAGTLIDRASPYTLPPSRIERAVMRYEAGVALELGRGTLDARRVWIGREYRGGGSHQWVELAVGASF